jgi:TRAP-type C4-dicarboxylate transport system permease small subunit
MSDTVLYVIVGLVFYQAYVTVRVARSKSFTPAQKKRHFLFIWLVPFIGAAMALADLAAKDRG